MAQPETSHPELSPQLSDFSAFLSRLSFLSTAVIPSLPSIAQVVPISTATDENHELQRPSTLNVSTNLKAVCSPSIVDNEPSPCVPVTIPSIVPAVVVTSAVEEASNNSNGSRDYPSPDPKTFEILFIYDDPAKSHAFSCRPSFYTTNQGLFLPDSVSSEDIFISSVEWRIREKSKQPFLIVTFSVEQQERRVFILAEGFVPEQGIDLKEGVILLSEFGRSLKRVDGDAQASGSGKGNEVELMNVNSGSKRREVRSSKQQRPHKFIRKVRFSPPSFNLLQLAILVDVAAKFRPQYNDLPSLSLWLTTIIYCIIKQKQPLENMHETIIDGTGRLLPNFKCCGYERSLMRPNSKKQLPYYLRKFDKAMTKFSDGKKRRENGVAISNSKLVQKFNALKSSIVQT